MVAPTDINIQNIFFPVLSIKRPKSGDANPDMKYTKLFTVFAFCGSIWNLSMKNFLNNYYISINTFYDTKIRFFTYFPKPMKGKIAT